LIQGVTINQFALYALTKEFSEVENLQYLRVSCRKDVTQDSSGSRNRVVSQPHQKKVGESRAMVELNKMISTRSYTMVMLFT
jgi:hypothetical protein